VIAVLCARVVAPRTAAVAAAAFLFSPFALFLQLGPLPTIAPLVIAVLGLLLVELLRSGSPPALALLGAVAGLAFNFPAFIPTTVMILAITALRAWRGPRPSPVVVAVALLSFLAGALPGIPHPEAFREMNRLYVAPQWPWSVAERAIQGQLSPVMSDWIAESPSWATPVAAVLSPFAISRNGMRLWGDVLFEPFATALAAAGLAICLRHAPRDRVSAAVLVFLALTIAPGFVSSTDTPSLIRMLVAPILMAVLTAGGVRGIALASGIALDEPREDSRRRVWQWLPAVAVVAIALGGTLIFDVVNPRILPASSLGLLIRSVDESMLARVALLTSARMESGRPGVGATVDPRVRQYHADWLRKHHPYVEDIMRTVPRRPIPVVSAESFLDAGEALPYDVLFWTPAVDQTTAMTDRVCRRWPDAALYTIVDKAGLSRVYAARALGPGWIPAVPASQWTMQRCPHRQSVPRMEQGAPPA
jgi:hypothetical protein